MSAARVSSFGTNVEPAFPGVRSGRSKPKLKVPESEHSTKPEGWGAIASLIRSCVGGEDKAGRHSSHMHTAHTPLDNMHFQNAIVFLQGVEILLTDRGLDKSRELYQLSRDIYRVAQVTVGPSHKRLVQGRPLEICMPASLHMVPTNLDTF